MVRCAGCLNPPRVVGSKGALSTLFFVDMGSRWSHALLAFIALFMRRSFLKRHVLDSNPLNTVTRMRPVLANYEVDFFYNTVEALETFAYATKWSVAGVPSYLTGSAITAHIQARLLHDNPTFKRIRHLKICGDGAA